MFTSLEAGQGLLNVYLAWRSEDDRIQTIIRQCLIEGCGRASKTMAVGEGLGRIRPTPHQCSQLNPIDLLEGLYMELGDAAVTYQCAIEPCHRYPPM